MPDVILAEKSFRGAAFRLDILDDLEGAPYNLDRSLTFENILPSLMNEAGQIVGLETGIAASNLAYRRDLAEQYLGTGDPEELSAMFLVGMHLSKLVKV